MGGIGIISGRIWGKSRRLLVNALGDFYNNSNPSIFFKITGQITMTDKVIMNQKLDDLNISHPKTYYSYFPDTDEECVIKHRYGSQGNHLIFTTFNKINNYNMDDRYVQHYVPFEREYRICINWERVLGIREKMPVGNNKIRNSKSCYYETRDIPELRKFAWKVFKKFGVEFTGMDIGEWNGKYIVIELNSSPTIGEYWARLIAEDLIKKLEDENAVC